MDEQQHRRRRHHSPLSTSEPDAFTDSDSTDSAASGKKMQANPPHHEGDSAHDTHHRSRREAHAAIPQPTAPENSDVFWHPESALLDAQPASPGKKSKKKKGLFALAGAIDAGVCRIGDCILYVLKQIPRGLSKAACFAALGFKKAHSFLKRLRSTKSGSATHAAIHTGKRVRSKTPPGKQTVTIEPARPQDYRGMVDKRSADKKRRIVRSPRRKFSAAYCALMAALICIALVSTVMIGRILWRTVRTMHLENTLSQRYSELSDSSEHPSSDVEAIPLISAAQNSTEVSASAMTESLSDDAPAQDQAPSSTRALTSKPTAQPKDTVKTTKFHQVGGDALPEMAALYQENRDLIGWLRMEEILDLPVVYRDNDYYLKRDFYKNKSAAGTLFLDENHPFRENAQNLLLHGHNMKDGTMFGRLVQYETNLQFLKNNPFIQYSTLWKKEQYVIFAVLHVSLDVHSDQFFNYFTHHTFSSDTQFDNYVRSLQTHSVYSIPIDVKPSDALLTLSTCLDDDRLVIVARRVREGESKSSLRHLVQLAAKQ